MWHNSKDSDCPCCCQENRVERHKGELLQIRIQGAVIDPDVSIDNLGVLRH